MKILMIFKNKILSLNFTFYIFVFLFALLLLMQYQLWFGSDNIPDSFKIKKQIEKQLLVNKQKLVQNNILYSKIQAYNHGSAGVEGQARYDLGMIKRGEDYFQFKQDDKVS